MTISHVLQCAVRRAVPFVLLAAVTAGVFVGVRRNLPPTPPGGNQGEMSGTDVPDTSREPSRSDTAGMGLTPGEITLTVQDAYSKPQILAFSGEVPFGEGMHAASVLKEAGFSLSDAAYAQNTHVLALADGMDFLPNTYSRTLGTTYKLSYERKTEMSAPTPVYTAVQTVLPALEPYMGYLVLAGSAETAVYTSGGAHLVTFPTGEYVSADTRDMAGNPLFYKETGGERQYFRIDEENGGFIPSDYIDSVHNRGVYFDYPAYYGVSDNGLSRIVQITTTAERVEVETEAATEPETDPAETEPTEPTFTVNVLSEERLWAYGYSAAWRRTGYYYTEAYNFSEGMACVLDADGKMRFLNDACYYAFYPNKNYFYHDWYVREYMLPPLTNGEESIGFFYYDHGLCRVRRQVSDWTFADRVAIDEDILIDKTGAEFPVPEGYDILAYSDGVILLEKDGKYGYMNYTGAWIAQPIYDYARPFFEGLAVVGFADGERLVLDTAGEIVIPAGIYTHISDMSSGVMAVYSADSGWNVLYKMAKYAE